MPDAKYKWPDSLTIPSGGWGPASYTSFDGLTWSREAAERLRADLRCDVSEVGWPQRWVIGIDPASINERSKPVGLTKEYEYTDNDGDTLTIDENDCDDKAIAWVSDMSSSGFNVTAENSVPLALNVLGYDRPDLERGECATRVGGYFAQGAVIRDQIERDELMATAASALKSIDFYDQGVAARRAEEAERQKRVEAKEAARRKLLDLTDEVSTRGVNPLRADALQIAVADYKKAIEAEKQYAKAF